MGLTDGVGYDIDPATGEMTFHDGTSIICDHGLDPAYCTECRQLSDHAANRVRDVPYPSSGGVLDIVAEMIRQAVDASLAKMRGWAEEVLEEAKSIRHKVLCQVVKGEDTLEDVLRRLKALEERDRDRQDDGR